MKVIDYNHEAAIIHIWIFIGIRKFQAIGESAWFWFFRILVRLILKNYHRERDINSAASPTATQKTDWKLYARYLRGNGKQLAENLYDIMDSNIDIPAADMPYSSSAAKVIIWALRWIARPPYTHMPFPRRKENGRNDIILQRALLLAQDKLSEALLEPSTEAFSWADREKYEVNGESALMPGWFWSAALSNKMKPWYYRNEAVECNRSTKVLRRRIPEFKPEWNENVPTEFFVRAKATRCVCNEREDFPDSPEMQVSLTKAGQVQYVLPERQFSQKSE